MAWRELELQVAARSTDPVFVHAGAIAIGDQGFVLPGRSGAGKTTLVLHLVEALDATYYSDEYALLDHDAYLHPYARDPHVRASGGGRGAPTPIAKYTQRVGTVPVPVCGVLVVARVEGERWVPTPANPRDCALSLLDNAVGARTRTPAVMDAVGAVIRSAWCVKGSRDSLTEVSGWLRERVANG
jgi:energy-coupling factor transporter ATP-binding protein EcfA2